MEQISNLIKILERKKTSERAEAIKFFVTTLKNKNGKPFGAKMIAIKLSHIPTKDLYYVQSVFRDAQNRKGLDYAQKWFWWSIKSDNINLT